METPETDKLVAFQNARANSLQDPTAILQELLNEMTVHAGIMESKFLAYHVDLQSANQANCDLQHELATARTLLDGRQQTIEILRGKREDLEKDSARLDWLTKRGGMAVDYATTGDGRKTNRYHFGSAVFTNDGLRAAVDEAMDVEAKQAKWASEAEPPTGGGEG